jgi:hypothetical protein
MGASGITTPRDLLLVLFFIILHCLVHYIVIWLSCSAFATFLIRSTAPILGLLLNSSFFHGQDI